MDDVVHVCTGECGAEISDAQYQGGLTVCAAATCTHKGMPFEKRHKCASCGAFFAEGKSHQCVK